MKKLFLFLLILTIGALAAAIFTFKKTADTEPAVISESGNIKVYAPLPNDKIGLPLVIRGEARVFENNFNYRLRDFDGDILYESFDTANAPDIGQFGPFEVSVNYPKPEGSNGTVEVLSYSAKDGSEINKVSIPVFFDAVVDDMAVKIFFGSSQEDPKGLDCEAVFPVERRIGKTAGTARAALEELFKGPTSNEVESGYFTSLNSGIKVQSLIIENGIAKADFNDLLQAGVAGSCRVMAIRSQIENTLKQFPTVQKTVFSINGKTEEILQP
ncbi:MAG: Gmad2 immunoglobulin-like domain-containing protein [Patescibacteria group bacterium]